MARYVLVRCAAAVLAILAVATLVFAFLRVIPGDPAELLLSGGGNGGSSASPEAVAALRTQLGLDEPVLSQYWDFISGLLSFDLGNSLQDRNSVSADIAATLPRTLELIFAATFLSVLVGVPLGVIAANRRGSWIDSAINAFVSVGIALPVFVIGTGLVLLFALQLGWLPSGGYVSFSEDPVTHLQLLILPSVSLAYFLAAVVARMTRSAVLDNLRQDWVRTARAKGLKRSQVLTRHVLRNSLSPVLTVIGLQMGALLGGTVLVEYVFSWPGLSSLLVQAAAQRDYPEVQGIVLVVSALFILLNLFVDIVQSFLDPRVRYD